MVHLWTMGGCIVYTRIRLLPLICPLISSFFFLSNCQTLTIFATLFSGTVRPRKLKLGTHVDNRCMYRVYRNEASAAYLSLYWSIFLSLQFSVINLSFSSDSTIVGLQSDPLTALVLSFCDSVILSFRHSVTFQMKIFRHTFLRNCEA